MNCNLIVHFLFLLFNFEVPRILSMSVYNFFNVADIISLNQKLMKFRKLCAG